MRARATAAEATRQRILDAAVSFLEARLRSDIRLEDIAQRARVSVQTVLRVYGTRGRLLQEALDEVTRGMAEHLDRADPGDVEASVRTWFDHYERFGDVVIKRLAEESDPAVRPIVQLGRARHRQRVERQLGPQLAGRPAEERARLVDALVCVCDVYTWKLLRRDMGRPRPQAEPTMAFMITSVLGGR